jgi:hypothetical protein
VEQSEIGLRRARRREQLRRLTVALKDAFRTEDGSFDLAAFKACLKGNDIEAPK